MTKTRSAPEQRRTAICRPSPVPHDFNLRNTQMQLGMIGLGRMGGNIVRRLMKHGHTAVVFDKDPQVVDSFGKEGAAGSPALEDFVKKLEKPRTAWVMLPAGKITET